MKFIVYASDDELIVTTTEDEDETVKAYFEEGGRDINEYNREVVKGFFVAYSSEN